MWAMMQKFRMRSGGVACGCSAVRAMGDTSGLTSGFSTTWRRPWTQAVLHPPMTTTQATTHRALWGQRGPDRTMAGSERDSTGDRATRTTLRTRGNACLLYTSDAADE